MQHTRHSRFVRIIAPAPTPEKHAAESFLADTFFVVDSGATHIIDCMCELFKKNKNVHGRKLLGTRIYTWVLGTSRKEA